jgi:hypothetical protein
MDLNVYIMTIHLPDEFLTFEHHTKYLCSKLTILGHPTNLQNPKKAFRTITRQSYTAHTDPIFNKLEILPFPKLINYSQINIIHTIVYSYSLPSPLLIFNVKNNII